MRKHLALTGFMAAGKSTIGKKLARKLGVDFYDVDELIVQDHGTIDRIFADEGEAQFRRYEFEAVKKLLDSSDSGVLAVGGGAVTYDPTFDLLKARTYRIFLQVPPERSLGRLRRSTHVRPLAGSEPSLEKLESLYEARLPRYTDADAIIDAVELHAGTVANRIVDWMRENQIVL